MRQSHMLYFFIVIVKLVDEALLALRHWFIGHISDTRNDADCISCHRPIGIYHTVDNKRVYE